MAEQSAPQALEFKPDFHEALTRWEAFWAGEVLDRPCIMMSCPQDGQEVPPGPAYMAGHDGNFRPVIDQVLERNAAIVFGGEAMPFYSPSFGPDMFAAFMGADLQWSDTDQSTNWAVPFVDDWDEALPLGIKPDNAWWLRMQDFMRELGQALAGKMLVAHIDLHSNTDALSAARLPERLCTDLYDCPETIDQAMAQVRPLYSYVYDTLYDAADMGRHGTCGWVPLYHPRKTNTIQCDFAALVGPEHFRRFVLPALEEEAAFLDRCCYHYDGPDCLVHIDDICAIEGLDVIQWTPGAGGKPFIEWMDLLQEFQAQGQGLWIPCSTEELKTYHRELRPEKVCYQCGAANEKEIEDTLTWLVRNT